MSTTHKDILPNPDSTLNLGSTALKWLAAYIVKLANLTSNGYVQTSGSDGTLSVKTSIDHGDDVGGLDGDDHTQYVLVDGTRPDETAIRYGWL